jgi:DNA-binding NarL/FixJ family response regulator
MVQSLQEQATLKIVIVDDHSLMLAGTLNVLRNRYPEASITTAKTSREAIKEISSFEPDLIVVDLSIPQELGCKSEIDTGIELLKTIMQTYPDMNIMVQSSHVKTLVRIQHEIDNHRGGFTIADKMLTEKEMLTRVQYALDKVTHTKDLPNKLETKPVWLEVLSLAFEEGLKDKEIAKRMNVAERTLRHYWTKIQDILEIYPETDKKKEVRNLRVLTQIRAREEGLID